MRTSNWQLLFEVMCDASDFAIGAVLGQREDGKPYVIYYASKTLNEAQRNYTTTEKELLAVVFALDKFRAYLVGSFIVVFTDHSALKYLLTKHIFSIFSFGGVVYKLLYRKWTNSISMEYSDPH